MMCTSIKTLHRFVNDNNQDPQRTQTLKWLLFFMAKQSWKTLKECTGHYIIRHECLSISHRAMCYQPHTLVMPCSHFTTV